MQKKKGISLIVLIITIIVMIILASSVILTLSNSGIINRANEAVEKSNLANVKHIASMGWSEAYLNGARTKKELELGVRKALEDNKISSKEFVTFVTTGGVDVMLASDWDHAYTCTNGLWGERVEGGQKAEGDIVAKFYKTGRTITLSEGELKTIESYCVRRPEPQQEEYKLVITGTGEMGNLYVDEGVLAWQKETEDFVASIKDTSSIFSTTEVIIEEGITSIPYCAFLDAVSLPSIAIPNSVTDIGDSSFSYCYSLSEIVIPANVANIGESAFSICESLEEIIIPDSLTSISYCCFGGCSKLREVVIPKSITDISSRAFQNCENFTSIKYKGTEAEWDAINIGASAFEGASSPTIIYNYTGQ